LDIALDYLSHILITITMPFRNATNRQIIIAFFVVAITIEYYVG